MSFWQWFGLYGVLFTNLLLAGATTWLGCLTARMLKHSKKDRIQAMEMTCMAELILNLECTGNNLVHVDAIFRDFNVYDFSLAVKIGNTKHTLSDVEAIKVERVRESGIKQSRGVGREEITELLRMLLMVQQ